MKTDTTHDQWESIPKGKFYRLLKSFKKENKNLDHMVISICDPPLDVFYIRTPVKQSINMPWCFEIIRNELFGDKNEYLVNRKFVI